MRRDPLSVFLHEKVAATDVPSTAGDPPRYVTSNPSADSIDPGERALAGLIAAGGSIAAKAIPWVLRPALNAAATSGTVPWHNAISTHDAKNVTDAIDNMKPPGGKLLGLFNLTARDPVPRIGADPDAPARAFGKLQEIQGVVDSFIDKHNLTEKGVRLNFSRGPLGSVLGPRYHIPTKQTFLTSVGKETVLHELGHAADYTSGAIGKARGVLEPIVRKGALVALPIALVAGDRIKEMMPGTIDDKAIEFMQNHAPEIMGATLAATELYPEAKASFLAVKHIAKTEGPEAARAALKKLVPAWGTYLLSAIPAVVGMSLARKYMREAREENEAEALPKTAGVLRDMWNSTADTALDLAHVGKQIGKQTINMIQEPGLGRRIIQASKEVGTSPEFVYGALGAAVPATMSALYLYGTNSGGEIRKRIDPADMKNFLSESGRPPPGAGLTKETWREQHPLRFAGLVAAGAALSGGVLAKFFSDLQRVI